MIYELMILAEAIIILITRLISIIFVLVTLFYELANVLFVLLNNTIFVIFGFGNPVFVYLTISALLIAVAMRIYTLLPSAGSGGGNK